MRKSLMAGPLALTASLLLMLAACSGGEEASNGSGLFVSNPSAVLTASATEFEQEVRSMRAEFSFDMDSPEGAIGAQGEFAYQAPDEIYMTMEMSGDATLNLEELGKIEILGLGDKIYMNMALTGWVVMSIDDLGVDSQSFREIMSGQAPFDYQSLVDSIGADVEDLGQDGSDHHLRVRADLGDIMSAMTDAFGGSGAGSGSLPVDDFAGPMTMDIWVNEQTLLPQRFEADGEFSFEGESLGFAMEMRFMDYNGGVEIPEPPAAAKSFTELFGGFEY